MQKSIIAVRGPANVGKTTTIRRAYEELRREGRCIDQGRLFSTEVIAAIWEIDGVKVGITSNGDLPEDLEENLARLLAAGCIVIVCATRTKGGTVKLVERLDKEASFHPDWIEKRADADHDSGNRQKATVIVEKVHKAIAEAQAA